MVPVIYNTKIGNTETNIQCDDMSKLGLVLLDSQL